MQNNGFDLVIREETLANEARTIITPDQLATLTKEGFKVALTQWDGRIYSEQEYESAVNTLGEPSNFKIITPEEWKQDKAYSNSIILGVKEIEDAPISTDDFFLDHAYIHFDHSYKGQHDSERRLARLGFNDPAKALLLDHEYSTDENGSRTHAFGKSAGYATTAISMISWASKVNGNSTDLTQYAYDTVEDFFAEHASKINAAIQTAGTSPKAVVLGSERGRSAKGARQFFSDLNQHIEGQNHIKPELWGREETGERQGNDGALHGIENFDLVINCTFSEAPCPSFMTDETAQKRDGKLQIIGDVTCDTTPDKNRMRFSAYETTDFDAPLCTVGENVHMVSIDHSPSFFPKEATDDISKQFFPLLQDLLHARKNGDIVPENSPWSRAYQTFQQNLYMPANAFHIGKHIGEEKGVPNAVLTDPVQFVETNKEQIKNYLESYVAEMSPLTPEEEQAFLYHVATGILNIGPRTSQIDDNAVNALTSALKDNINISDMANSEMSQRRQALSIVFKESLHDPELLQNNGFEDRAAFLEAYEKGKLPKGLCSYFTYISGAAAAICNNIPKTTNLEEMKAKALSEASVNPEYIEKISQIVTSSKEGYTPV